MAASSTHDTKRSEDARARLAVLSELSSSWRLWLRRWSMLNRSHRTEVHGESAPSRADEYHFYQALIAVWPADAERLKTYMLKAAREAKLRTSWINPDGAYEAALERFVAESLANPLFQKDLGEVMPRLAHLGFLVSLSQALLKVASPGVPDYYQGSELIDLSLVDPDNRRPVDFGARQRILGELEKRAPQLADLSDGRAKLHVIRRGLAVRKAHAALFHGGEYRPLYADAGYEEQLIAFSLGAGGDTVVALAPRLFARRLGEAVAPVGAYWAEARIALPQADYQDAISGRAHRGGTARLSELLADFPAALLIPGSKKRAA